MKRFVTAAVLLAGLALAVTGCSRSAGSLDQREEQDPMLKRARAKKQAQDIEGAITLYTTALDRKPRLARAHLELGLLYDGYKEDYVRALYHYERYLELRPRTEKKELIEDLVRRARISFAATLPDTPSGAIEEISELKRENEALKHKLATMGQQPPSRAAMAASKPPPGKAETLPQVTLPSTPPPVLTTPKPAPAQEAVQTYRVQRGDTLSSIAAKMYNDPGKWKKIYDANQGTMSSPSSLKVGQTLVIPN